MVENAARKLAVAGVFSCLGKEQGGSTGFTVPGQGVNFQNPSGLSRSTPVAVWHSGLGMLRFGSVLVAFGAYGLIIYPLLTFIILHHPSSTFDASLPLSHYLPTDHNGATEKLDNHKPQLRIVLPLHLFVF